MAVKPLVAHSGYIALSHEIVTNRRPRQPRANAWIIDNPIPSDRDRDRDRSIVDFVLHRSWDLHRVEDHSSELTAQPSVTSWRVTSPFADSNSPFLLWCTYLEAARAVFGIKNLNL